MSTDLVQTKMANGKLGVTVRQFWTDIERRNVFVMRISIPANLTMAAWKVVLLVITPSLFLLANAAFNIGCAVAKTLAVRCSKSCSLEEAVGDNPVDGEFETGSAGKEWKTYKHLGVIVTVFAFVYTLSCTPMFFSSEHQEPYDQILAITIATITFTEIGLNVRGMVVARSGNRILLEGIKWLNLASALLLVVLTQTALMSFANKEDNPAANALSGVVFGSLATGIGVYMLIRYRRAKIASLVGREDSAIKRKRQTM